MLRSRPPLGAHSNLRTCKDPVQDLAQALKFQKRAFLPAAGISACGANRLKLMQQEREALRVHTARLSPTGSAPLSGNQRIVAGPRAIASTMHGSIKRSFLLTLPSQSRRTPKNSLAGKP